MPLGVHQTINLGLGIIHSQLTECSEATGEWDIVHVDDPDLVRGKGEGGEIGGGHRDGGGMVVMGGMARVVVDVDKSFSTILALIDLRR